MEYSGSSDFFFLDFSYTASMVACMMSFAKKNERREAKFSAINPQTHKTMEKPTYWSGVGRWKR